MSALNDFLGREAQGGPIEAAQRRAPGGVGLAQADFLAREALGSPIEARELGRPVNGVDAPADEPQEGAYPGDLAVLHARLVRWFEEAESGTQEERLLAERDRDYVDNFDDDQWTEAEKKVLRARGQPITTTNYVRRKIQLLCGLERKSRTDPKAFPRTPTEEERADAATQALRYVSDSTNLPLVRSSVYENMLVEGFGGAELGLEDDGKGGANLTLTHVPWDRLFRDPHSRQADFEDARYKGIVIWMDRDQVQDMYPDAEDVLTDTFGASSGTFGDRPGQVSWLDNRRERTRVVQVHFVERGVWWIATITRAGFLAEPAQSPFLDARGRSASGLVLQSASVDRKNRRFGEARDLISQQDAINKRESKSLHLLSVAQVIAEQGAVDDEDKARREAAKPDGWITVTPGLKLTIDRGGDLATGQFQMLQHSIGQMQASGPNASMSGNDPRDLSGRAIIAQQAGGAAQNEPMADHLRQWTRRLYEMAWMAVRQFWTGERWVRVTDDMGATQWVGLNRQVTLADELAAMPDEQRAMTMQRMMLVPGDPRLAQVVRVENDISDLEVDITIEEGPDVPAMQAEDFQALVQLAGSQPGLIDGEDLISASSLRNKAEILARIKERKEGQAQQAQQAAALAQAGAEADVRGKEAQAAANDALALERRTKAAGKVHEIATTPMGQPQAQSPQ